MSPVIGGPTRRLVFAASRRQGRQYLGSWPRRPRTGTSAPQVEQVVLPATRSGRIGRRRQARHWRHRSGIGPRLPTSVNFLQSGQMIARGDEFQSMGVSVPQSGALHLRRLETPMSYVLVYTCGRAAEPRF